MHSILQDILKEKEREIEILKQSSFYESYIPNNRKIKSLKKILQKNDLTIIGEIKRRSPSKGNLASIKDPVILLEEYIQGGVSGISVLTDEKFFGGSLEDLNRVSEALSSYDIPLLRKDFILDALQIKEALHHGADVILLIVAVLGDKTKSLLDVAKKLGLDVIVEVHTHEELHIALRSGADIIGINNRNLNTFEERLETSLELIKEIPSHIYAISESAIKNAEHVSQLVKAGFHGILVGESLVKSQNPVETLKTLRGI